MTRLVGVPQPRIGISDAESSALSFGEEDARYTYSNLRSTLDVSVESASATQPLSRLLSRFGSIMVPIAAAAAFVSPFRRMEVPYVVSTTRRSQTRTGDVFWLLDGWTYSEEQATPEQLLLLRDLLALSSSEGLMLDLTD
jgi:hypothetical protein